MDRKEPWSRNNKSRFVIYALAPYLETESCWGLMLGRFFIGDVIYDL